MARRFKSQTSKLEDTSPMSSTEAAAEHSGVSEEDVTGSQELLFSEQQVPPTRLLENMTLEDISCDLGNIQEPLITTSEPTGPSSTVAAVTPQSSLLPMAKPSQAACESVEVLAQPDVGKRVKCRDICMAESSSSLPKVQKLEVTPQTRGGLESVTRNTHVTSRPSPRPTASKGASQEPTRTSLIPWKALQGPTWVNPTPGPALQGPTWVNPTPGPALQGPTWVNPTPGPALQGPTRVKPTPGPALQGPTRVNPTPGPALQGPTRVNPTPGPALQGPTWANPIPGPALQGPTRVKPTPGPALQGPTWVNPTPGPALQGPTRVKPTPGPALQGPTWANPTPGPALQGPTRVKPTPGPALQGPTWVNPTPGPALQGPTRVKPTPGPALQGPTWANPTPGPALQGPTRVKPTPGPALQGPTWANPIPGPALQGPTRVKPTPGPALQGPTWANPIPGPALQGPTRVKPTPGPALQGPTWANPIPGPALQGPTRVKPTPGPALQGPTWANPIPGPALQGPTRVKPTPGPALQGPTRVKPTPGPALQGPTRVKPTPGPALQGPTWVNPTPGPALQGPTWVNPTDREAPQGPTPASSTDLEAPQGPTWASSTDLEAPHGSTWASSTDLEAPHGSIWASSTYSEAPHGSIWASSTYSEVPQGPTWASSTDLEAPHGSTWASSTYSEAPHGSIWASSTYSEAPHGSIWASSTDLEAPHGSTWASSADREAPHGSTWVNPIDWKASEDPILVNAAVCGISQGPVKADGNVSTSPRERIGVFLRKEEHNFRQEVPQTAVTKSPLYCQIRFPMRKGSLVTIFSLTESGLFKTGEELCVCEKFLMGTCQNDSSCLCYHTLLPFHWQFHHKYDNCWYSVPIGTQMHLEMTYANPNHKAAKIVYLGKILYLDMNLRIFQPSYPSCFDYARRICCNSDSPFAPASEIYYHSNYKWLPYDQENENPSSNLQTPDGTKRNLTATQLKEKYLVKISRPKYVPLYQYVNNLRIWRSEKANLSLWGEEPTDIYIGEHPYKNKVTTMANNDYFTVVEMAPSEPAYQHCCQLFHTSIPPEQAVVLRIYRLYNPYFWKLYIREKKRLKRLQIPSPLEYHLFCQAPISLEELTKYGLCPKRASMEGLLGSGLYFSLSANILTSKKTVNSGYMTVLAKVLIGEKTLGNYLFNSAPRKENGYEYDACVNDMNTPTLFTVFRRELTYPYFIIFYKCVEDPVHLVY